MASVKIQQNHAHLAANVRLEFVNTSDGRKAKATLTVISNARFGSGEDRRDVPTSIQWTAWGKQAENAAEYLCKGSHVNVSGRMENNNYTKNGEAVYAFNFVAEEIDYLDTKEQAEARRAGNQAE